MSSISAARLTSRLEVKIHFRTLISSVASETDPAKINTALKKLIRPSQDLFLLHNILLKPVSYASLDQPELKVHDADESGASEEQKALVQAFFPRRTDVAVFLVDSIIDSTLNPVLGSAVRSLSAVMISKYATEWTFGHEMAHLLGVDGHEIDPARLMFEDTRQITAKPFPLLTWDELLKIRCSPFAQPVS